MSNNPYTYYTGYTARAGSRSPDPRLLLRIRGSSSTLPGSCDLRTCCGLRPGDPGRLRQWLKSPVLALKVVSRYNLSIATQKPLRFDPRGFERESYEDTNNFAIIIKIILHYLKIDVKQIFKDAKQMKI